MIPDQIPKKYWSIGEMCNLINNKFYFERPVVSSLLRYYESKDRWLRTKRDSKGMRRFDKKLMNKWLHLASFMITGRYTVKGSIYETQQLYINHEELRKL